MQVCKTCNLEKPEDMFYGSTYRDGKYKECKQCSNIRSKNWAKNNPEKVKENRRKTKLKQKYGISIEQYNTMFKNQDGKCYICHKEHTRRPLNVDHNHSNGQVRGLLCDKCNMALGLVKDSTEILTDMIRYLNAYSIVGHRDKPDDSICLGNMGSKHIS
jgi:hypothetical protein